VTRSSDIAVAGRAVRDVWHDTGESTVTTFGGPAANIAYNLGCLGLRCALATVFGADTFSRRYRRRLQARGVDLRCSKATGQALPTCETWLGPHREYAWRHGNDGLAPLAVLRVDGLKELAATVIFGDLPLFVLNGRHLATTSYWAPGGAVFTDVRWVRQAARLRWGVVFLNCKEAAYVEACVGRDLRSLSTARPATTWIVTNGQEPTRMYRSGRVMSFPVEPTRVVNASGGGDAFAAGVAAALHQRLGIRSAIIVGQAAAAITVRELSAQATQLNWGLLLEEVVSWRSPGRVPPRLFAVLRDHEGNSGGTRGRQ
jgi:sugar/nucleoside kinase (ribokinase family)